MKKVFLSGCFDPLHDGHRYFFSKAKRFGDILVVGVMSDEYIQKTKKYTPMNSEGERIEAVLSEKPVEEAVIIPYDGISAIELILKISPDIHCLGPGQYDKLWNNHLRGILRRYNENVEFRDIEAYRREINCSAFIRSKIGE